MFKVTEAEVEEEDGIHEKRLRGINCTGTRDGEIERERLRKMRRYQPNGGIRDHFQRINQMNGIIL